MLETKAIFLVNIQTGMIYQGQAERYPKGQTYSVWIDGDELVNLIIFPRNDDEYYLDYIDKAFKNKSKLLKRPYDIMLYEQGGSESPKDHSKYQGAESAYLLFSTLDKAKSINKEIIIPRILKFNNEEVNRLSAEFQRLVEQTNKLEELLKNL